MIGARFPADVTKAIDQWAADNGNIGRSEAMRRLVEQAPRMDEASAESDKTDDNFYDAFRCVAVTDEQG